MLGSSIEDFMRRPVGHYYAANSFVYWYPHPDINGITLRGSPCPDDIRELTQLMDAMLRVRATPHSSLIDARSLTHADPIAFSELAHYVVQRWPALSGVIRRQALVRPVGLVGAVVAGFYQVLPPSFPVGVFDTLEDALEWLGPSAGEHAKNALEELNSAERPDALLIRLRARLESDCSKVSCERMARELGVSERTLQRRLQAAGTSFHEEVQQARVRAAQKLMLTSEANLTAIALEIGCASLQHYSSLFRKVTGQSPSEWRKQAVHADRR